MTTITVKPADGLKVRKEDGRGHFAAEGEKAELTTYIRRRLKAGDLVEVAATKSTKKKES